MPVSSLGRLRWCCKWTEAAGGRTTNSKKRNGDCEFHPMWLARWHFLIWGYSTWTAKHGSLLMKCKGHLRFGIIEANDTGITGDGPVVQVSAMLTCSFGHSFHWIHLCRSSFHLFSLPLTLPSANQSWRNSGRASSRYSGVRGSHRDTEEQCQAHTVIGCCWSRFEDV